jgi:hypothetical protein
MKITLSIMIAFILIHFNLSLCSQNNLATENTEMDIIEFCILSNWKLEEQKQAIKKFIRQQFKKGYSLETIHYKAQKLANNTKEEQIYQQSKKIKQDLRRKLRHKLNKECTVNGWYYEEEHNIIDTPECKSIEQNYLKELEEEKKLNKITENTPEKIITRKLSAILSIEQRILDLLQRSERDIDEEIKEHLQRKQRIGEIIQELSKKEKEFLNSLFQ